ncbi:hypothetical protein [Thalassospira marina]|uniref:Uncharacterized protein n=1 Tax=Thalassospira marina TaxID=2048283 RepID=A0ABM6QCN3_9PROT|nr:hypothetical protein [Thalassospira marina]AUG53908.1 hypothetical protein CSC3H3_15185 [Thalassospira marina]
MLSQKLANVTAALRKMAHQTGGKLSLDAATTDILLTNLQELADRFETYEKTNGPLIVGEASLLAIERGVARGQVVNLADRRTSRALRHDLTPGPGGAA